MTENVNWLIETLTAQCSVSCLFSPATSYLFSSVFYLNIYRDMCELDTCRPVLHLHTNLL